MLKYKFEKIKPTTELLFIDDIDRYRQTACVHCTDENFSPSKERSGKSLFGIAIENIDQLKDQLKGRTGMSIVASEIMNYNR